MDLTGWMPLSSYYPIFWTLGYALAAVVVIYYVEKE